MVDNIRGASLWYMEGDKLDDPRYAGWRAQQEEKLRALDFENRLRTINIFILIAVSLALLLAFMFATSRNQNTQVSEAHSVVQTQATTASSSKATESQNANDTVWSSDEDEPNCLKGTKLCDVKGWK